MIYPNNNIVQKFSKNDKGGRDFVVGDIHGCLADFTALLKIINFNKQIDRMFSVGDLVDRGPDSLGCAELIYEPWFIHVRANHEQLMIDSVLNSSKSNRDCWTMNGGNWHYDVDVQLLRVIAQDFDKAPYVIIYGEGEDRINICHAELIAADDKMVDEWYELNQFVPNWQENNLIWGRSIIFNSEARAPGLSLTIVGHTLQREPVYHQGANHLFIDTGSFMVYRQSHTPQDGWITCVDITDKNNLLITSYSGLYKNVHTFTMDTVKRMGY